MENVKHTPGTWINDNGHIRGKWETGEVVGVANVGATTFCGDEAGSEKAIRMKSEDQANARLIAASPSLYEFVASEARKNNESAKIMLASLGLSY